MQLQRTQRVEEHDGAVCVSDPFFFFFWPSMEISLNLNINKSITS